MLNVITSAVFVTSYFAPMFLYRMLDATITFGNFHKFFRKCFLPTACPPSPKINTCYKWAKQYRPAADRYNGSFLGFICKTAGLKETTGPLLFPGN